MRIRHRPAVGAAPGELAKRTAVAPARLYAFMYSADALEERVVTLADLDVCKAGSGRFVWIDVQGSDDIAAAEAVGQHFGIHPLAVADAVNTPARPKFDAFDDQLVFVSQMVRPSDGQALGFSVEQLTVVIGPGWLVTFQEREHGDVFEPVRERLRAGKGPVRRLGPGYLAYALIDSLVDGYYPVLEEVGERLEGLEADIMHAPDTKLLEQVRKTKRGLLRLRRDLWPQRDALSQLLHADTPLVNAETAPYWRDLYDHAVQLMDVLEGYRELASSLNDVFLSSQSNRMNEVMKLLAMISTVFMPMSLITGIYGMNFQHMPELAKPWGYPVALGLMAVIGVTMLGFFLSRGWIGRGK